jgi:uncharacterized coiled-coil DUF342 family protein
MGRIRRFNEQTTPRLSKERCDEIMDELGQISEELLGMIEKTDTLTEEVKEYSGKGKTDQIDRSVVKMAQVKKNMEDINTLIDDTLAELKEYSEDGRQYIV